MATAEQVAAIYESAKRDLGRVTTKEGYLASAQDQKFGTIFGRDALITSEFTFETFRIHPEKFEILKPVRNSLVTLALSQGKNINKWRDEEPGKIIHELRRGGNDVNQQWLRQLKEASWPVEEKNGTLFMDYYGSADATPLFVKVASEYFLKTGDVKFFKWQDPFIRKAIDWMGTYGDAQGDGYMRFAAKNRHALLNQGWKDSFDSIEAVPGKRPKEPIALVELQGYAYSAYLSAADAYMKLGDTAFAKKLYQAAGALKVKFNEDFWMEDAGFFAYALDGDNNQTKDITSNVGHLLMTGIIDEAKLRQVVRRLMQSDMLTRWGIRTLSLDSANFSDKEPSAYHNGGAVWPHDNGIIYLGLKRTGFVRDATIVRDGVFEAQFALKDQYQLENEEVYLVDRHGKLRPYDKACHPQSWTAAVNRTWADPLEIDQLKVA